MAHLYPTNADFSTREESEQRAITGFLNALDDSWYIVPHVMITNKGVDHEIDVVLVSHDHGLFCAEVKGGVITVESGDWKSNGKPIKNPAEQVLGAKYSLIKRLKSIGVATESMFVQHIVVLPDMADFPIEGAGTSCPRDIVLTAAELPYANQSISHLRRSSTAVVGRDVIEKVLKALRPDVRDVEISGSYLRGVTQRIGQVTHENLGALLPLDVNRRIFVEGAAGTGKTFLANHWTRRAVARGERTLFVCYNRALGNDLYRLLQVDSSDVLDQNLLRTGSFHAVANLILGENAVSVPENADQEFWNTKHAEALIAHRNDIALRFDTIIVDEGQDFLPQWFVALEGLLSDPIEGRVYVTTDPRQAIFSAPLSPSPGATIIPLKRNIRNSRSIGAKVARLGGAKVSANTSPGPSIVRFTIGGFKEQRKRIADAINEAHRKLEIPLSQILVVVPHRADVDRLCGESVGDYTVVPWQHRDEGSVACGTIQGTKGLERLAVIVSNMDDEPSRQLSYIGASRATLFLAAVGKEAFIEHFSISASDSTTVE